MTVRRDGVSDNTHPVNLLPDGADAQPDRIPLYEVYMRMAEELAKRSTGKTIYLLDEPTTGLHFDDVRRLLTVLQRLVDKGNTVLVIEHSLDVIKTSDWIIDLGPDGGNGGGTIVAEGPPEHVATVKASFTGHYLKPLLAK